MRLTHSSITSFGVRSIVARFLLKRLRPGSAPAVSAQKPRQAAGKAEPDESLVGACRLGLARLEPCAHAFLLPIGEFLAGGEQVGQVVVIGPSGNITHRPRQ